MSLNELRRICGAREILPKSCMLSCSLLTVDRLPFISGSSGDLYEGTLGGTRVCVKRVRMYSEGDRQELSEVCHRRHCSPHLSPPLISPTEALPGSCGVETSGAPEYRPPPGYYHHPPRVRFGMDVPWKFDGTPCPRLPRHDKPNPSRMLPSCCIGWHIYPLIRWLISLKASTTSTLAM